MESNEGIDEHIAKLIEDKNISDITFVLRRDLIKRDANLMERWDEIYYSLPSCKDIQNGKDYHAAMIKKYIKTYKMCLEEFEKQQSEN